MVLADNSGADVNLTVWGERATKAKALYSNNPVVAFRRARLSDFGGRSLSTSHQGAVTVQPLVPEADRLKSWWSTVGAAAGTTNTRSLSSSRGGAGRFPAFAERKTISSIRGENMGQSQSEKPDWISFKGTFNFLKKDREGGAWYPACSNAGDPCKNMYKVQQTPDGNWQCERCGTTAPNCVRRYIFSATVIDDTCTTWVSVFNEQAETMFEGRQADDVFAKCFDPDKGMDEDQYNSMFDAANFQDWVITCKVKQEIVADEARVKSSIYSLHPVDYAKESRDLLAAIAAF